MSFDSCERAFSSLRRQHGLLLNVLLGGLVFTHSGGLTEGLHIFVRALNRAESLKDDPCTSSPQPERL